MGPPKAATTSLQYYLQSLDSDRFFYGGVLNPRTHERTNIASDLFSAITGDNLLAIQNAVKAVEHVLAGGRHVVLSEERFLLDGRKPHQELIHKLGDALGHLDPVACLTLRDPVAGIQSMYQQFHWRLPPDEQASFDRFLNGNQARVYDYGHLEKLLLKTGFIIRCVEFESLVNGDSSLSDLTGDPVHESIPVRLEHRNAGKRVTRETRMVGARSVAAFIRPEKLLGKSVNEKLRQKRMLRLAWDKLRVLKVLPGEERNLRLPHDMEKRLRERMAGLSTRVPPAQAGTGE